MEASEATVLRIKEIMSYFQLNQSAFAKQIGIDTGNLSKILNGKRQCEEGVLNKILLAFDNLNRSWLLAGDGEMLAKGETVAAEETRPRLPMYAAAGSLSAFATSALARDCEQVPVIHALPNYDYTMIIKGDSMEPKFEGGDEIAIRKVNDVIEWGKVYVLDTSDGAVVKRLYDNGDKFRCVSYNNSYPDFMVSKENVFGVYKVVGLIRYEL